MNNRKKIVVLSGGRSEESEVSKVSAAEIAAALRNSDFEVITLDPIAFDSYAEMILEINKIDPYIVFNGLHGSEGENGRLQALFDLHGIAYTGSGYRACALAMDKYVSSILASTLQIKTPQKIILFNEDSEALSDLADLKYPLVVKPNDSGVLICLPVKPPEDLTQFHVPHKVLCV